MLWWVFQACYALAVILWLAAAMLLLREFFREYRGKLYDTSRLSPHAGIPDHGPLEITESQDFLAWKNMKYRNIRRALLLFAGGIALHAGLHYTQEYFLPRFAIPYYTSPAGQAPSGSDQPPE